MGTLPGKNTKYTFEKGILYTKVDSNHLGPGEYDVAESSFIKKSFNARAKKSMERLDQISKRNSTAF